MRCQACQLRAGRVGRRTFSRRPRNVLCAHQKAPGRSLSPRAAGASAATSQEPSRSAPRSGQPCGGLRPPLPARGTGCQGPPAWFPELGRRGFSTLLSTPTGNAQNQPPSAEVYKALSFRRRERLGEPERQEDPPDPGSRRVPGSGRLRPHEDPQAGAESLAQPGPKSCGGLRALDRSVLERDEGPELEAGGGALAGPPPPPFPRTSSLGPLARSPPPGASNGAGVILHFS